MSTVENQIRVEQGFEVFVLRNAHIELSVVPQLGARIVSLRNLRSGREWLWHPIAGLKLFSNQLGDDFSSSPLAGIDECMPTIAPCSCNGRSLPDHGEVWSAAWEVDRRAWECGVMRTSISLAVSPFEFQRTVRLCERSIVLEYRLRNVSSGNEEFLWALHPLLNIQDGDRLEMPTQTREMLNGEAWIDSVDSVIPASGCAKTFASPLKIGRAGIHNKQSGDRLSFEWNAAENNTLGLWLTRGGWHGHHHLAIEPSNGMPDALSDAIGYQRCGIVPAFGSLAWSLRLHVESQGRSC